MPRGKKSKAAEESDEEGDPGPSQSQTATQASAKITREELDKKVNDLVHYLLVFDQKKVPIKKQDINKAVMKEHNKLFPEVLSRAKEKLKMIFGLDLVELDAKQKSYILVNQIEGDAEEDQDVPRIQWSPKDNSRMGLLIFILANIFMSGNVIQDATLWHALKKLGVDCNTPHEEFGDVKKLVTQEFVREGYLEYTRQPATDPPVYEFRWGQRASLETTKRNVLDFVCQIYGDTNPENWLSQYSDAQLDDERQPAASA